MGQLGGTGAWASHDPVRRGEVPAGRRRARRRAAWCADAAAGVGAVGGAALVAMFAVEVPTGGPYYFGTLNDVTGALYNALTIPVIAELGAELPAGWVRDRLTPAALGASAVGAASSALLVARLLPFAPSTALSVAAMEVQATWLVAASSRLRARPGRLTRLGTLLGAALLGSTPLVALGALLPQGRRRHAVLALGAGSGGLAWLALPWWQHLAARYLDEAAPPATPSPAVDRPRPGGA